MQSAVLLSCPQCQWKSQCGPAAMLQWLREARQLRRGAEPEPELLSELFRAAADKFACPNCSTIGLVVGDMPAEDDEEWGMGRACEACRKPISSERLELIPGARLCATCQGRSDRGELAGPAEYCPRCGSVMTLRQSRGAGITRYVMACPSCRR